MDVGKKLVREIALDGESHRLIEQINPGNQHGNSKCSCLFLYFATLTGSLSYFVVGSCLVWMSPVLPQLTSNNTDINPLGSPVTPYEISLIGGTFAVGSTISPLLTGKLADALGRKNTMLILGVINAVFLLLLAFAPSLIWMLVARAITGLSLGAESTVLSVFLIEISGVHDRGKICAFSILFLPFGQLYGYVMGSLFSMRYFTVLCALPIFVHTIVIAFFVPESPEYLLQKGKREAAIESLRKYRGKISNEEVEKDMQLLEYTIQQTTKDHDGSLKTIIFHQPTRRAFILAFTLQFIQLGTGIGVILPFLGPIFQEANTPLSGNDTAILVGTVKIVLYFIVAQVITKFGRNKLMFTSTLLCSISLFALGICFFLSEKKIVFNSFLSWIPIGSILFYIFAYSIGIGSIPFGTTSELFDSKIRSQGVAIANFSIRIFATVFVTFYPIMAEYIGISGCMWLYSGICALGAIFIQLAMPEIEGKSNEEIQEMLRSKKKCSNGKSNVL